MRKNQVHVRSFVLGVSALCWILFPSASGAVTRVFVQNNTPHVLSVSTQQTGAFLAREHWHQTAAAVLPGQRLEVLWFNRDTGITAGERFRFATRLKLDGHEIDLVQELLGKTINSHLWQTVGVDGVFDQWWDNNDDHWAEVKTAGEPTRILYRSFFTGTDDNIEYVLTQRPVVEPSGPTAIKVLAYNVYLRSILLNGQSIRTDSLKQELDGAWDVIVLSEAFDDDLRDDLVAALAPRFPFHSKVLGTERGIEEDGGVIVISRWPIEREDQRRFGDNCSGSDCMADKGVLYTRLNKQGMRFHLFASHTNANNESADIAVRSGQLQTIQNWMNEMALDPQEPVLVAGDLNVDKGQAGQYAEMLGILGAFAPAQKGLPYSFDPGINDLASSGPPELLDYVLYSRNHRQPVLASSRVLLLRHASGWKEFPHEPTMYDLSDHFAVLGEFEFGMQVGLVSPPVEVKARPLPAETASAQQVPVDNLELSPCREYARVSVAQEEENQERGCGFVGPEWSTNHGWHFDWCVRGRNVDFTDDAMKERAKRLSRCDGR